MAKTESKIESIEEQIKRLQDKKKRLEQKQRTNVGKIVFEKWEIEDEKLAIELIEYLAPFAKEYIDEKTNNNKAESVSIDG